MAYSPDVPVCVWPKLPQKSATVLTQPKNVSIL
jgi:hypothetical protein